MQRTLAICATRHYSLGSGRRFGPCGSNQIRFGHAVLFGTYVNGHPRASHNSRPSSFETRGEQRGPLSRVTPKFSCWTRKSKQQPRNKVGLELWVAPKCPFPQGRNKTPWPQCTWFRLYGQNTGLVWIWALRGAHS